MNLNHQLRHNLHFHNHYHPNHRHCPSHHHYGTTPIAATFTTTAVPSPLSLLPHQHHPGHHYHQSLPPPPPHHSPLLFYVIHHQPSLTINQIISETGNKEVVVRLLDTADLTSVRHFAKEVLRTEGAIHILVNNAGIPGKEMREVTKDGLELTLATNHYGHFLLTNLLLKRLQESAPSRIINVSSSAHFFTWDIDLKDLNFENRSYGTLAAYGQSKLCNILFTVELAHKLRGSGVTVNALNPGAVGSEFMDGRENMAASWWRKLFLFVSYYFLKLFAKNSQLGAQTTIHLAVSEEVEGITGKYFDECKEATTSWLARDLSLARALWEVSEADVKLLPSEIFY